MEKILAILLITSLTFANPPKFVILKNGSKTQVIDYKTFKKQFKELIDKFKPTLICFK